MTLRISIDARSGNCVGLVIHYIEYRAGEDVGFDSMLGEIGIDPLAPIAGHALEYDRRHLALYAALLDAAGAGRDWKCAATELMLLDVTDPAAEACWRSHLERARWIVGEGLAEAIVAFSRRPGEIEGT